MTVGFPAPASAPPATFRRHTLAEYLDRSIQALDRDNALGRIPRGFKLGGTLFWLRSEIEAWLQAGAPPRVEWEARKAAAGR